MLPTFKFHHIGFATPNIEATVSIYVSAGYSVSELIDDPLQNIRICFLTKENMPTVELLTPIDDKSPVVKFIEKNGVAPYHCCYISDNLERDITELRAMKFVIVSKPKKACAINDKRVAFLWHKDVGLIELVES